MLSMFLYLSGVVLATALAVEVSNVEVKEWVYWLIGLIWPILPLIAIVRVIYLSLTKRG